MTQYPSITICFTVGPKFFNLVCPSYSRMKEVTFVYLHVFFFSFEPKTQLELHRYESKKLNFIFFVQHNKGERNFSNSFVAYICLFIYSYRKTAIYSQLNFPFTAEKWVRAIWLCFTVFAWSFFYQSHWLYLLAKYAAILIVKFCSNPLSFATLSCRLHFLGNLLNLHLQVFI